MPNNHGVWPLHEATLLHLQDTLVAAAGLPGVVDTPPDSVLFSPGVHAFFGLPHLASRPARELTRRPEHEKAPPAGGGGFGGGDTGNRTPDLLLAKQALYQLSYVPEW